MSRLFDVALGVISWENNHLKQINDCLKRGCPPGEVEDIRKALADAIKNADGDLTKSELDVLTKIELKGEVNR